MKASTSLRTLTSPKPGQREISSRVACTILVNDYFPRSQSLKPTRWGEKDTNPETAAQRQHIRLVDPFHSRQRLVEMGAIVLVRPLLEHGRRFGFVELVGGDILGCLFCSVRTKRDQFESGLGGRRKDGRLASKLP